MGLALPKIFNADDDSAGLSVRTRLRAWWNGYELDSALHNLPESGDSVEPSPTPPSVRTEAQRHANPLTDPNEWSPAQRQLAEALWTPGFIVPGGAEYVQELVGFCRLTPAETMLEIGAGMGGGTRAIISKFGNYVTGYEPNEALAEECRKQAVVADIDGKLKIASEPLAEIELKSGYFRAALIRDVLCTIEDKEKFLTEVCQSLKAGTSYLIFTGFLYDDSTMTPEVEAWIDGERCPVYPWTIDKLKSCVESSGVMARIVEDESDRYCSMVTGAWSSYLAELQKTEVPSELGGLITDEANYWGRRTAALQSGGLRYYRLEGIRNS